MKSKGYVVVGWSVRAGALDVVVGGELLGLFYCDWCWLVGGRGWSVCVGSDGDGGCGDVIGVVGV